MNKVILMGRLTRDPDVRYSQGENATAVARYTLAVDRRFRRDGDQTADFIGCVAFGRQAEFAEKYLRKGIKILVEDNGNGIASTDQSKIFNRFYRGKASTTDIPGMGLGLAYVKLLTDAHGGEISVESTEGVGSSFSIKLPQ